MKKEPILYLNVNEIKRGHLVIEWRTKHHSGTLDVTPLFYFLKALLTWEQSKECKECKKLNKKYKSNKNWTVFCPKHGLQKAKRVIFN